MSLRDDWAKGRAFRVIKEGAYLDGLTLVPDVHYTAHQGWRHHLAVGDVITSLGVTPGWGSDPGYGVHWTCDAVVKDGVSHAEFKPSAGNIWSFHPVDGFLEPVE